MDELFERPKKDTKPRRGRPPGRKNNKTLAKEAEMRAKEEQVSKSIRKYDDEDDEDDLMLCDLADELWQHPSSSVDWEKLKQYDELYLKLRGEHFIRDFEYMDDANARNVVDRYLGYIAWNNHGNEPHWMENPEYLFQPFIDAESILDMMEEQGDMEYYDDTPEVKDVIDMLRGLKKGKRDRAVIWNPQTGESKTFDMSKPKDAEEVARLTEEEGWEYESYPESDMDFNKARGDEMKASKSKVEKWADEGTGQPGYIKNMTTVADIGYALMMALSDVPGLDAESKERIHEEVLNRLEVNDEGKIVFKSKVNKDWSGQLGDIEPTVISASLPNEGDVYENIYTGAKWRIISVDKPPIFEDQDDPMRYQVTYINDKTGDSAIHPWENVRSMLQYNGFVKKSNSVSFKSHTGTFKPIAKAGHYTMWQSVEHGDKAYNIITQTKKNRKTGQLVEKIIKERVDGFEDPEVQKMFGIRKIDRSGGIYLR